MPGKSSTSKKPRKHKVSLASGRGAKPVHLSELTKVLMGGGMLVYFPRTRYSVGDDS